VSRGKQRPHACYSALVAHVGEANPGAGGLEVLDSWRELGRSEEHEGGHAQASCGDMDQLGLVAVALEMGGKLDGGGEAMEVGLEAGAAEEGVGNGGDLLQCDGDEVRQRGAVG